MSTILPCAVKAIQYAHIMTPDLSQNTKKTAEILTAQTPRRFTMKFPLNLAASICEMTYRLDTRALCRMMGMLDV